MASTIRFIEIINNGPALRECAISTDDFKWAYAGTGDNRYLEFFDQSVGAERVATITTGSYANLTGSTRPLLLVTSSVSGIGKYDAPVSGVPTTTGTFYINIQNVAVAYLTATGSSNVQYVFNGKCYEFAITSTPTDLTDVESGSDIKSLSAPFPLRFINNNRVFTLATGTFGCTFSYRYLKTACTISGDTAYSAVTSPSAVVTEIYLNTPDNLVLATTTDLATVIP